MATKLIKLAEGILVEVEVSDQQAETIGSGFIQKVDSSIDKIQPLLVTICHPVVAAWREIKDQVDVDKITIELGLSFEGEGNLFVTKSKVAASITVSLELKLSERQVQLIIPKE